MTSKTLTGSSANYVLSADDVTLTNLGTLTGNTALLVNGTNDIVLNGGTIAANAGSGTGVVLARPGAFTNQATGIVSGFDGIQVKTTGIGVTNAGTVTGDARNGIGIYLEQGGAVTNLAGGTINAHLGIKAIRAAATVTNAGSIGGGGDAVLLAAGYANRVIVDPGAVFTGTVGGGNALTSQAPAVSTLELASGASGGTLTGLGTQFIDFADVTIDSQASWTFSGANTLGNLGTLTDSGTLTNVGSLVSSLGITLTAGAELVNAADAALGTVGSGGIVGIGDAVTVVNTGVITGRSDAGQYAVALHDGGAVLNQSGGTIAGFGGILLLNGPDAVADTLVNAGLITANAQIGIGVLVGGVGSFTNQAGGTVSAGTGVYLSVATTVTNAGSIAGTTDAVQFETGVAGTVVVDPGASFIGTVDGGNTLGSSIVSTLEFAAGKLAGTFSGIGSQYIDFGNILVDSGATWTASGTNTVGRNGTFTDSGTLTNIGSFSGAALTLASGVTLTNAAAGTITGTVFNAVVGVGAPATVQNYGSIGGLGLNAVAGGGAGVLLGVGGSVTNHAGGVLTGGYGVYIDGVPGTVVNAGRIATSTLGTGVLLRKGGSVSNQEAATITGNIGISALDEPLTVVNAGGITGHAAQGDGVDGDAGGSVTNQGSGTISGNHGVSLTGGAATVVNAGSIEGNVDAVLLAAGFADRLVVQQGATFTGTVDGGNTLGSPTISTLEFTSATSAGTVSGLGSQFVDFARIDFDSNADWTLTGANTIAAGVTLTELGGASLTATGTLENDGSIVLDPSRLTVAGLTGTGAVKIDAGSVLEVQGTIAGGETIAFAGSGGALHLDNPSSVAGHVTNFAMGDVIDLKGVDPGSVNYSAGLLSFGDGRFFSLALAAGGTVVATTSADGAAVAVVCFVAGTRIMTTDGEVPVERLAPGDRVVTLDAADGLAVRWTGRRRIDTRQHPRPDLVQPVLIRHGAFADGTPHRDLRVSPDHAIHIDGLLVPARLLINGATIVQDRTEACFTYWHVELDRHAVLFAEGLATESYLDTGNRGFFENAAAPRVLHPDLTEDADAMRGCAPFAFDAARVEPLWRRLAARAHLLGHAVVQPAATSAPDLRIAVNGRERRPVSITADRHVFVLPPSTPWVRLVSRAGAPCAVTPWADDRRCLGVAVGRIALRGSFGMIEMPVDHPSLTDGWWDAETCEGSLRRWTDGSAALPVPTGTWLVEIGLVGAMRYRTEATAAVEAA